jgi:hypothetical protein
MNLTPSPFMQFFTAGGIPLVGGKLYTYAAGTTTPLATYTTASGAQSNTNPIILDSRGEAAVWLSTTAAYKFKLTDSTNVEIWTADNIEGSVGAADLAASTGSSLVGYLPAGSGAVATTVQTKLRESVSVQDFGADPTGAVDATTAINAALAASKCVSFGDAGDTYKISGTLTVQTGSTLIFNGATVTQITTQTPMFDVRSTTGVTISGGNFVGKAESPFTNTAGSLAICVRGASAINLSVRNNTFTGFCYSPLMVALTGTNIEFIDNFVTGPGVAVLGIPSAGNRNCTGVTILGNGVTIRGNTIQDTSEGIIVGQQSTDVVIDGNIIKNTLVEHGIYCDTGIQRLTISNNLIHDTCGIGMKVQWYNDAVLTQVPSDMTIIGNVIQNTGTEPTLGGDGILVYNSTPATVGTLSGVTAANPAVFTTVAAHGLAVGDIINITGVVGMTNAASAVANTLNDTFVVATTPLTTTFTVTNYTGSALSTVGWSAWTSGGTIAKALYGNNVSITGNSVRTVSQDGISLRYVKNAVVSGNVVDTCGRIGLYGLYIANVDFANNNVSNTQYNGIDIYAPLTPCSIRSNTFTNLGLAAVATNGGNSGILLDSNGGGVVSYNTVIGESTQTKMLYGIQIGSGDKRNYAVDRNIISNASSAGIALWNDTPNVYALKSLFNNISASATGVNAYTGLPTATPGRGTSQREFFGDAAPTTGAWIQGDKVWAQFPVLDGPVGWVNVSGGSPGTWAAFGANSSGPAGTGDFAIVTASSKILVGATTSAGVQGLQVYGSSATGAANVVQRAFANDANGANLLLVKTRGTTATSVNLVANDDTLGQVQFFASNGVAPSNTALVYSKIGPSADWGATSSTSLPTLIGFSTTNAGSTSASTRMTIDPDGVVNIYAKIRVNQLTAIPAGGSQAQALNFSSTANFGVFYGSGVPTLSAAQGSLYLRSDGSSTSTRMYVNTNGSTTWTAVTTVA